MKIEFKITVLMYFLFIGNIRAQNAFKFWPTTLGANIGTGFIYGELNKHKFASHVGLFAEWKLGKYWRPAIQLTNCNYKSAANDIGFSPSVGIENDKNNLKLISTSQQLSLSMGYNILPDILNKRKINLAIQIGFGFISANSILKYTDKRDSLGTINPNANYGNSVTETYEGRHFIVPMGLVLDFKLNQHWFLGAQAQFIQTVTDHLDVVNVPNNMFLFNDKIANFWLRIGYTIE